MANEQGQHMKIWEIETRGPEGESKNRLELWQRNDGGFMFLAQTGAEESVTAFPIEHPQQVQHLITAGVFVLNSLAHVPPMMPEGLDPSSEIVATYFNGHQEQTEAGHVLDWSIIDTYMVLGSDKVVHLRGGVPVGEE